MQATSSSSSSPVSARSLLDRRRAFALLSALGVSPELLAQDPARADPRGYTVLLDNRQLRVLEYVSRPGMGVCGPGVHSHPAHLTIAMTPVKARVEEADGRIVFAGNKAGDVFWSEAVTHSVENIGGSNARAYLIELKGPA